MNNTSRKNKDRNSSTSSKVFGTLILSFFAIFSTNCSDDDDNNRVVENEMGTVIYKEGVVFMEDVAGYISVSMEETDGEETRFQFTFSDPESVNLTRDNVIIGRNEAPFYFHKVTSVSSENDQLIVFGTPATMDDAIEFADISVSVAIGGRESDSKFDIYQDEFSIPVVEYYNPRLFEMQDESGIIRAKLGTTRNSKIEISGGYELELRMNLCERYFKLTFYGNMTGGLGIKGEVNAGARFNKSIPLFEDLLRVNMFSLIGIPITVNTNFDVNLQANFSSTAKVLVSRTISQSASFYMEYARGGWSYGLDEENTEFELDDDLQLRIDGRANFLVGIDAALSVGMGGKIFGLGIEGDAGLKMSSRLKFRATGEADFVDPGEEVMTYDLDACTDIGLSAGMGFHMFVINRESHWDHELFSQCWDLADGELTF